MKTNFLKSIFFAALSAVLFTGCVNDDDYDVPNLECVDSSFTVTKTVAQVYAAATTTATEYTADDVIEARIVSSDKGGNFYKIMYMNSLDGQIGFSFAANATDLFINYDVGRKVYIKLKGLYVQIRSNTLQIGALYQGNVGQVAALELPKKIGRTCNVVTDEEELVNHLTLADVNNSNLGKLIEFDAVQFATGSVGQNYYNPLNVVGSETNHLITDASGKTLIFRTGSFAEYAGTPVSSKSGKIRGILTKFNSDFQFVARYATDIKLTEPRIGGEIDPGTEPSGTAVGGTELSYTGSVSENFESYAITNPFFSVFTKYINDKTDGERFWQVKQFPASTGNKYIEMTSYNGTNPAVAGKTYFFVPVDFTSASNFTFKKEFRYMAGQALKVYYVTAANYTALGAVNIANFVDITSSFTGLTYPASGASENAFTSAGNYSIPASVTGNGFFVFEYTGTTTITTTVQLDDILIN